VFSRSRKFLFAWILATTCVVSANAQQPDPEDEDQMRFRFVGPRVGNRIAAVAGVPGDPSTYYAGAASGGVWKSTDGGNRWAPIFDKQPAAAIGALAVAPSDPSVVWAGTGEAWVIRDSDVMGNGIYKSTDAGKTWTNMGLQETGRIGRVVVHPTNPDIVFACALGRATGPQQERGVFRTIDGGQHWERVLFGGENVGCSGLSMDPHNSRTLFAGMWQVELHTWAELSGGPGSGIYVSRDGGTKWTRIEEHGLPHAPVGKIDVAVAPTNSKRARPTFPVTLHRGERQAILLAEELGAEVLLIDEQIGRTIALSRNLPLSGTLGVLERADRKGFVSDFPQILQRLKSSVFFITEALEQ
jgi:predicted nucleic acid-binding protein